MVILFAYENNYSSDGDIQIDMVTGHCDSASIDHITWAFERVLTDILFHGEKQVNKPRMVEVLSLLRATREFANKDSINEALQSLDYFCTEAKQEYNINFIYKVK